MIIHITRSIKSTAPLRLVKKLQPVDRKLHDALPSEWIEPKEIVQCLPRSCQSAWLIFSQVTQSLLSFRLAKILIRAMTYPCLLTQDFANFDRRPWQICDCLRQVWRSQYLRQMTTQLFHSSKNIITRLK